MNSLSLTSIRHCTNQYFTSGMNLGTPRLLALVLWLIPLAPATAATILQDVEYAALPGNEVRIDLQLSGAVKQPQAFATENPARVVLDLEGVASGLDKKEVPISVGPVQSLVAVEASNRTRVVINLSNSVPYQIETAGNKISIALNVPPTAATAPRAPSRPTAGRTPSRAAGVTSGVRDIDFRRGPNGEGRVLITLPSPNTQVSVNEKGRHVIAEIANASLPSRLRRRLDVTDFATPVIAVESRPQNNNVEIAIETTADYEYLAYQADELFTLEFRPLTKAEREDKRRKKDVYTGDRLSLNFQDIEVRAVLQLLADFTGLNLVASDTVRGRITLRLKNVPWDQALAIILKSKGLSMRQIGNVVMVAPTREMVAQEQAELLADQKIEELAPLRSEFIQVNYARASALTALLKSDENRLLSGRGNVTFDDRTNTLLVQDTAAKLEDIRGIVQKLDIPVRQVMIESRVVIANNDFARDLGVRFGASKTNDPSFNPDGTVNNGNFGEAGGALPGYIQNSGDIVPNLYQSPAGVAPLLVDLPVVAPSGGVNFILGKIGSYLLQLELTAMQREGRGEIVSSPRVITSDNQKATIKVGQEIPYQESSASGRTTVAFKEAVLQLDVTPQITPDDRVIMALKVNKDNPDFANRVLGVPPVDTRSVETNVLVDNGETVVLGGVYERQKTFNKEQVPWLGDLPVLGNLFKTTAKQDQNEELLVFVTPKILKEGIAAQAYAPAAPAGPTPRELMK
ncbi:MAG: type IV pilus secretin PilQ [Chromatiaceae bacterium]|nr:type IV pilus secretin PilQ [Chromatiaceae bacterium]